jgi:TIR domain
MVKNLETVDHIGPSTIGIDTIYRSQGRIPEAFLKGAGVPDSFLDYMRSLVGKPIDYYSCFISYSSKDQAFAERLYADLQSKGVRCWFAPHDMRIGDEIRPRIDESIRVHDKLLLVLSESSLTSTWVKKEVETAFENEAQQNKLVLFPVRLDDTVMHTQEAWAADIRRMRHIGDFRQWKQHDEYQQAFARLLRDLQSTS